MPIYYFVRVNGDTVHNNPHRPDWYMPGEPPQYPATYFDACAFCLKRGIVRIGWPGTGDLRLRDQAGARRKVSVKPA